MEMVAQDLFSLKWNNYQENMSAGFRSLFDQDQLTDVTIYSGDTSWRAHRVVLCASSPYFEKLLGDRLTLWQHPVLILNNIHPSSLQSILEYIYSGKVTLENSRLEDFMRVGDMLNIKGLSTSQSTPIKSSFRQEAPAPKPMVRIVKQKRSSTEKNLEHHRPKERKLLDSSYRNISPQSQQISDDHNVTKNDEGGGLGKFNPVDPIKEEPLDTEFPPNQAESIEMLVVKPDPEDFKQSADDHSDRTMPPLTIRNDLLLPSDRTSSGQVVTSMFGESGRCHFCSEECGSKVDLTEHLKTVHMPLKHALCENCENFFHVCAIQRHKLKCQARYHGES